MISKWPSIASLKRLVHNVLWMLISKGLGPFSPFHFFFFVSLFTTKENLKSWCALELQSCIVGGEGRQYRVVRYWVDDIINNVSENFPLFLSEKVFTWNHLYQSNPFLPVFVPTGRSGEGHHGVSRHLGRSSGVLPVPERQADGIWFTADEHTPTARPLAGLRPLAAGVMSRRQQRFVGGVVEFRVRTATLHCCCCRTNAACLQSAPRGHCFSLFVLENKGGCFSSAAPAGGQAQHWPVVQPSGQVRKHAVVRRPEPTQRLHLSPGGKAQHQRCKPVASQPLLFTR